MSRTLCLTFCAAAVLSAGCYHATINTGLPPGTEGIHKTWAHGFLYGLVPPATVEAASKCTNGVARVETQSSFLNMVASAITFGIYTPMQIDVTCAARAAADAEISGTDAEVVVADAIDRSLKTHRPVIIQIAQ
jgi:hypothetical protein